MVPLYIRLKNARRDSGRSQAQLAEAVDCTQSAISMMEQGRHDALSQEKLAAIANVLGVKPDDAGHAGRSTETTVLKVCPIADCPSNTPFMVAGQLRFLPHPVQAPATAISRCVFCGEILESACAICNAPIRPGACCEACGNAYVPPLTTGSAHDTASWVAAQTENVVRLRSLLTPANFG